MQRRSRYSILSLSFFLLFELITGFAHCSKPSPLYWNVRASDNYLAGRAITWLNWSGSAVGGGSSCISCHTSMPIALALSSRQWQLPGTLAAEAETKLTQDVKLRVKNWVEIATTAVPDNEPFRCYYGDRKPSSLGTESVMNALVLVNHDRVSGNDSLDASSRSALRYLWQQQQPDGSWLWLDFGLNPWEKDGTYYGSALAALAVGMAGSNYYDQSDMKRNLASLRQYLKTNFIKQRLHDQVVCLWASAWLPGILTGVEKAKLVKRLIAIQNADGGWSLQNLAAAAGQSNSWTSAGMYPAGNISDGYATGLLVLALKESGGTASSHSLQRGVQWLIANERDGSWPANYINGTRDPNSMTGMFMRDAATAYAALALETCDGRTVRSQLAGGAKKFLLRY